VHAAGGELAGIYYCPHAPEADCDCRKPRPGLFKQLERELGLTVRGAPYVGDKLSDVDAAEAAGARPILVRTGHGAGAETVATARGVAVFDDLAAAAKNLLAESRA